jgi:hypothetical protein
MINPSMTGWLVAYGLLSFFCLAGSLMEHFAVMQGWSVVGSEDFAAVHTKQSNGIVGVYVIPKMALTIMIVVLLVIHPSGVPIALFWVSLILLVVSWAVSFLVEIPTQRRIRQSKSLTLIRRLITFDWIRVGAVVFHAVTVCVVLIYQLG